MAWPGRWANGPKTSSWVSRSPSRRSPASFFLRLVTVDDAGGQVRRRLTRSVAEGLPVDQSAMEKVLRVFGDHRLITFDRHPLTRGPTVEVAHEALLTGWERLTAWIGERRQELSLTRRLDDAAEQWMEAGQDRSYLLTGGRLEQAETLAAASDLALSCLGALLPRRQPSR